MNGSRERHTPARDEVPVFFGYPAWSCAVLLPLFAVVTWLWLV